MHTYMHAYTQHQCAALLTLEGKVGRELPLLAHHSVDPDSVALTVDREGVIVGNAVRRAPVRGG